MVEPDQITITWRRYKQLVLRERILVDLYKLKMDILAAKEKEVEFSPQGPSDHGCASSLPDGPPLKFGPGGLFVKPYTPKESPFVTNLRRVLASSAVIIPARCLRRLFRK